MVLLTFATAGIVGAAFGPYAGKETGETALFRELLEQLRAGDIVVADRYYCSYFMIALLTARAASTPLFACTTIVITISAAVVTSATTITSSNGNDRNVPTGWTEATYSACRKPSRCAKFVSRWTNRAAAAATSWSRPPCLNHANVQFGRYR